MDSLLSRTLMKIVNATNEIPGMTTGEEVEKFLESKLNLQMQPSMKKMSLISNSCGFTMIKTKKTLIITSKLAKKTQNLRNRPTIYFSIDDKNPPYKGVKGKGNANVVEDTKLIIPQADKISMKYLGTLDHPAAKEMADR